MKKVFSGIQPTGNLHLGNYLGAIKNWIALQDQYKCLFGVMNLHAITIKQDPNELKKNCYIAVATYQACGLDEKKSKIFIQSQISEHLELAWVLASITPVGWLNRMTQFKDKIGDSSGSDGENKIANLGLYSYPVLMAADILLYKSDLVPVGDDQKQHLELTRDIAMAFNRSFNVDYFKLPEPLILNQTARIMSLQDGTKKMSKSDSSTISRINLNDSADDILKKVKKSKTDSLNNITYDESRHEIYNLLNIFSSFTNQPPALIAKQYETAGYGKFKQDLADIIIANISPISKKISQYLDDLNYLDSIIEEGQNFASEIAKTNKHEIYKILGLN